jgi:outer membrane protein OmpA-like peptidoglycan-associated protein
VLIVVTSVDRRHAYLSASTGLARVARPRSGSHELTRSGNGGKVRSMRLMTSILFACALAAPAAAQEQDAEGSKDHPMLSRMPGYYIVDYDAQDFGSYTFLSGYDDRHVEGRYWKISYRMKENAKKAGPLQIARNYTDLLVKRGGKRLEEHIDAGGGSSVATMPAGGKNIWVEIQVTDAGEDYDLIVVEEAAMEQQVEFTAMELARALKENGSVALHNILFDTGKATIKPESAAALTPIGEILKTDPSLVLEIVGHTDNVGTAAANLKLSRDRAAAVKMYLVQTLGIDTARLTTAGFGDTRPVASNNTEEGRAQNRRVELVRK